MDGFLFIDKPSGPPSFALIKQLKPQCNRSKIGHAGTLDPAASGLLIIALGKATRLLEYLPGEPKVYEFECNFGVETDSLDNEGKVLRQDGRIPSQAELTTILPRFIGNQMQIPPRFSALKVLGERAYDLARKNEDFTLAPRSIVIHELKLLNFQENSAKALCRVSCSKGTYVRSLVRDIALALGTVAHASEIRRIATGPFTLDMAMPIAAVENSIEHRLVPIKKAFENCRTILLNHDQIVTLSFGADIALPLTDKREGPVFAFNDSGEIVAVLKKKNETIFHPEKVFGWKNLPIL